MFIDISFPIRPETMVYPGDPPFLAKRLSDAGDGDLSTVSLFSLGSHLGTHLDAPRHFFPEGADVASIPLERLCGRALVIHIPYKLYIEDTDLKEYDIKEGSIVLFRTANSAFDGIHPLSFYVSLAPSGALFLAEKKVALVGIDYITIEPVASADFFVHKTLLGQGIPILETLCLGHAEAGEYELYCLPLKIENGDACPVRAVLKTLDK